MSSNIGAAVSLGIQPGTPLASVRQAQSGYDPLAGTTPDVSSVLNGNSIS